MTLDRFTSRDGADSSRTSDNSSHLRASVSDDEMQSFFRNRTASNRAAGVSELGSLSLVERAIGLAQQHVEIPNIDSISEFELRAQDIFFRFDENRNGYLSRAELGRAVENPQITGEDAQAVAGLFDAQTWSRMVNFSNDEWGSESEVSLRDIQGLHNNERDLQVAMSGRLMPWATENFASVDADGNGYIAGAEIDSALSNDRISLLERNALNHMRAAYANLQQASNDEWFAENDGITRSDLTAYAGRIGALRLDQEAGNSAMFMARRTREGAMYPHGRELYGGLEPAAAITPEAIAQGRIADCYFLATLASVAQSNPQQIQNMIRDNGNGTYTVAFPGDPAHPVTVAAPTQAETGIGNRGGRFGNWAGVLERAFAQWRLEQGNSRFPDAAIVLEGAHGPGDATFPLQVLMGGSSTEQALSQTTDEQLVEQLNTALNSGNGSRAVVASIPGEADSQRTADGFAQHHLYSILAFERTGANDGFVTVRNPWGGGPNSPDGSMRISVAQFRRNFGTYTIQN